MEGSWCGLSMGIVWCGLSMGMGMVRFKHGHGHGVVTAWGIRESEMLLINLVTGQSMAPSQQHWAIGVYHLA